MQDKFQNKYRIPSARLQNWDYSWNAAYFVTTCTKNREHFFGEIVDGKMELSEFGVLAQKFWQEIPEHFPFVALGNFVIMPNHVHGILILNKPDDNNERVTVETPKLGVSTIAAKSNDSAYFGSANKKPVGKNEKWKPDTRGVIVNQYKRIVTLTVRKTNPDFAWQTRFHDHIIRDELAFNRIANYILRNPFKWEDDKFFT
jgi:putative transposase